MGDRPVLTMDELLGDEEESTQTPQSVIPLDDLIQTAPLAQPAPAVTMDDLLSETPAAAPAPHTFQSFIPQGNLGAQAPVRQNIGIPFDPRMEDAIQSSPDPETARKVYELSVVLHQDQGIPYGMAFAAARSIVNSPDPKTKTYGQAIVDEVKRTLYSTREADLWILHKNARGNPEEQAKVLQQIKYLRDKMPSDDTDKRGILQRIGLGFIYGGAQQVSLAESNMQKNVWEELGSLAKDFWINGLQMRWRKQVSTLKSIGAEATGMGRMEGGNAYGRMIEAGVDENVAASLSDNVAILNGSIEMLSDAITANLILRPLGAGFKGIAKEEFKVVMQRFAQRLGWDGAITELGLRLTAKIAAGTATNLGEELTQDTVTFYAEKIAAMYTADQIWKKYGSRYGELTDEERGQMGAEFAKLDELATPLKERLVQTLGQWPEFAGMGLMPAIGELRGGIKQAEAKIAKAAVPEAAGGKRQVSTRDVEVVKSEISDKVTQIADILAEQQVAKKIDRAEAIADPETREKIAPLVAELEQTAQTVRDLQTAAEASLPKLETFDAVFAANLFELATHADRIEKELSRYRPKTERVVEQAAPEAEAPDVDVVDAVPAVARGEATPEQIATWRKNAAEYELATGIQLEMPAQKTEVPGITPPRVFSPYLAKAIQERLPQFSPVQAGLAEKVIEFRAKREGMDTKAYVEERFAPQIFSLEETSARVLAQQPGANAAVTILNDGKALVHALGQTDFKALMHEFVHVMAQHLTAEESAMVEQTFGTGVQAEERFAEAMIRMMKTGVTEHEPLKGLMTELATLLYGARTNYAEVVSPEAAKMLDSFLVPEAKQTTAKGATGTLYETRGKHGTAVPHEGFREEFMGTGEGSAAFGWGVYVTSVEGIGRRYAEIAQRNKGGDKILIAGDKQFNGQDLATALSVLNADVKETLQTLESAFRTGPERVAEVLDERVASLKAVLENAKDKGWDVSEPAWFQRLQDKVDASGDIVATVKAAATTTVKVEGAPRVLMDVTINPDADDVWLDWGEYISPEVRSMISAQLEKEGVTISTGMLEDSPNIIPPTGELIYRELEAQLGSAKAASKFLDRAGITGTRMPAEFFKRGGRAGAPYNYAVYDPAKVRIDQKTLFNIAPAYQETLKELIAANDPNAQLYTSALQIQRRIESEPGFLRWEPTKKWLEDTAGYWMSTDPDVLCQRSIFADKAVKYLKDVLGEEYSKADAEMLLASAFKADLPVPCPPCYVFSARMNVPTFTSQKKFVIGIGGFSGSTIESMEYAAKNVLMTKHKEAISAFRQNSSSDAKAEEIPGLITQTVVAQKLKLPLGGYTKEAWYAKMFGAAGYYLNMSISSDPKASMDIAEAKALRKQYPTLAIVANAFNDKEVFDYLSDPEIDRVLPVHLSGQKQSQLNRLSGVEGRDYTREQNETINGKKVSSKLKVRDWDHGGDMDKYRAVCKERGITELFPSILEQLIGTPGEKNYMKLVGPEYGKFGVEFPYSPPDASKIDLSMIDEVIEYRKRQLEQGAKDEAAWQKVAESVVAWHRAGGAETLAEGTEVAQGPIKEMPASVAANHPSTFYNMEVSRAQTEVEAGNWVSDDLLQVYKDEPWAQEEISTRQAIRNIAESVASSGGTIEDFEDELSSMAEFTKGEAILRGTEKSVFEKSPEYVQELWSHIEWSTPQGLFDEATVEADPFAKGVVEDQQADARISSALAHEEKAPRLWYGQARVDDLTAQLAEGYEGGRTGVEGERVGQILDDYAAIQKDVTDPETRDLLRTKRDLVNTLVVGFMRSPTAAIGGRAGKELLELQSGYTPEKLGKNTERIRKLLKQWQTTSKTGAVPPLLQQLLNMRSLKDLTVGELRSLYEQANEIRERGRVVTKAAQEAYKVEVKANTEQVLDALSKLKPKKVMPRIRGGKEYAKALETGKDIPQWLAIRPNRWAEWLDGDKRGISYKLLWTNIDKAMGEMKRNKVRRAKAVDAKMVELGLKPKDLMKLVKVNGQTFNVVQALAVYIYTKNDDTKASLTSDQGNNISEDELEEFAKALKPKVRELGDWILESFQGKDKERLVNFTLDKLGLQFKDVTQYFPKVVVNAIYGSHADQVVKDMMSRSPAKRASLAKGFLKQRTGNVGELKLNAMATYEDAIEKQERLMALHDAIKMANAVYSNKEVERELLRVFGKEAVQVIKSHIVDTANPSRGAAQDLVMGMLMNLRSRIVAGGIIGNPTSWLKNLPIVGIQNYRAYTSAHNMVGGLAQWMFNRAAGTKESLYDFVTSRDPWVLDRVIDPMYEEAKTEQWSKTASAKQRTMKILSVVGQALDTGTVLPGWKAAYDFAKETGRSEEEAIAWAHDASLKTQPQGETAVLPYFLKKESGKLIALYANQINQNWNMITADIPLAAKDRDQIITKRIAFITKQMSGIITTGLLLGIISSKRIPEDKKEWAEIIASTLIAPIPIIGDEIVSWVEGRGVFGSQSAYTQVIGKVARAAQTLTSDEKDFEDKWKAAVDILPEAVRIMGGPAVLISRLIKSAREKNLWPMVGGAPKERQ